MHGARLRHLKVAVALAIGSLGAQVCEPLFGVTSAYAAPASQKAKAKKPAKPKSEKKKSVALAKKSAKGAKAKAKPSKLSKLEAARDPAAARRAEPRPPVAPAPQYTGETAAAPRSFGTGGGTRLSADLVAYRTAFATKLKSGWRWKKESPLYEAAVRLEIAPDGKVERVQVERSSGNQEFDESVVRAVRESSPLPAPPAHLYSQFQSVRVVFNSAE